MTEASPRVQIAGLGNVLEGDDDFGAELLRRLFAIGCEPATGLPGDAPAAASPGLSASVARAAGAALARVEILVSRWTARNAEARREPGGR